MFNIENNFQNIFFLYTCPSLNLECINLKNEKILSVDSYFTASDLDLNLEFQQYYKFTIIRNPWETLVSIYLNLQNSQSNTYLSRSAKFFNFKDWAIYASNILKLPNTYYTHSENNKQLINFVIRYEYFNQDFKKFCSIHNVPYKEIKTYMTKDYQKYYDKDLIEYLNSFLKIDEINYGYKV